MPPENLIVQGYGEQFLKIDIEGDIRANRRATVRRITPLLRSASLKLTRIPDGAVPHFRPIRCPILARIPLT